MAYRARTHTHIMITGATGLIGGALAVELLKQTDARLACLVRPRADQGAQQRLNAALIRTAFAYGTEVSRDELARCHAIAGDITRPPAADVVSSIGRVDQFWHSAASLNFEQGRAEDIALQNVVGTELAIDLAKKLHVEQFNYISTAYVAGTLRGRIPEKRVRTGTLSNNAYESSKVAAENSALDARFDANRVFRPSIVIGHSQTYAATTFSGLYGFVRAIQRVRDTVQQAVGRDLLKEQPLQLLADPNTPINLIPVDTVVRTAVDISLASAASDIFHLANSTPPRLGDSWDAATRVLDMMRPVYTTDRTNFTIIDSKVNERMDFFRDYLNDEKYFETRNTERILGPTALSVPLPPDEIARYVRWFVDNELSQAA